MAAAGERDVGVEPAALGRQVRVLQRGAQRFENLPQPGGDRLRAGPGDTGVAKHAERVERQQERRRRLGRGDADVGKLTETLRRHMPEKGERQVQILRARGTPAGLARDVPRQFRQRMANPGVGNERVKVRSE